MRQVQLSIKSIDEMYATLTSQQKILDNILEGNGTKNKKDLTLESKKWTMAVGGRLNNSRYNWIQCAVTQVNWAWNPAHESRAPPR